jgi:hypothetical protein
MSIAENLLQVRQQMAAACARAGRAPSEVALMAVSKVHPVECLIEAHAAGHRLFGENRVQEWQAKYAQAGSLDGIEMHLIGPLQANKTGPAAKYFAAIDTVDSLRIARRLNDAAAALGKVLPVLIEVKLSPEETKHGVAPGDLPTLLDRADDRAALARGCGQRRRRGAALLSATAPASRGLAAGASHAHRSFHGHVQRLRRGHRGRLDLRAHRNGHLRRPHAQSIRRAQAVKLERANANGLAVRLASRPR